MPSRTRAHGCLYQTWCRGTHPQNRVLTQVRAGTGGTHAAESLVRATWELNKKPGARRRLRVRRSATNGALAAFVGPRHRRLRAPMQQHDPRPAYAFIAAASDSVTPVPMPHDVLPVEIGDCAVDRLNQSHIPLHSSAWQVTHCFECVSSARAVRGRSRLRVSQRRGSESAISEYSWAPGCHDVPAR
jgi:hypothetical protein